MSASRRCLRLRFLLYSLGALVCIARFISFTWDLPSESPRTFSPTPAFNTLCSLPFVPPHPTSFDETAPIPGYPYWNPQDGPPYTPPLDSYRYIALSAPLPPRLQPMYEQLRTLWWFAAQLGRTVILPTVQGKNETASRALIESVWSLSDMSRVTAFISPTEFAAISARCRDSKHSVQLRFETTVVTDGIPQVPVPDHFVMHAELAAVRHQVGRNSSALALYYVHAMNEGDPCVVELGLDRCPPSLFVYSESLAKVFAGLERHYMHYNITVYQWAFRALEKLLPPSYAAAYLTVPRLPIDATWKLLETSLSEKHSVYLAALDPSDADFVALVATLRRIGVAVTTIAELATLFATEPHDHAVLEAVEQVLLAAATPFYFTPSDLFADQTIALRERLGNPSAAEERAKWLVHTRIPASQLERKPMLVCELGPEV